MDSIINPLNAKLNTICHLLALLGAHSILHVSRVRVNSIILGLWIKCKLSLYSHDIKTSQILSPNTVTVPENLLLG